MVTNKEKFEEIKKVINESDLFSVIKEDKNIIHYKIIGTGLSIKVGLFPALEYFFISLLYEKFPEHPFLTMRMVEVTLEQILELELPTKVKEFFLYHLDLFKT